MKRTLAALVIAALSLLAAPAFADPLPNQFPKFDQQPEIGVTILDANGVASTYNGHDELSTARAITNTTGQITGYAGTFMADDFADTFNTPVYHITWWGSYLPNGTIFNPQVQKFLVSFETDVPAIAGTFSHPGSVISSEVVTMGAITPGSGTFTENVVTGSTSVDGPVYKYNAELALPFAEQKDTVYWLKIVALDDGITSANPNGVPIQWGWHDRDFTQNDTLASVPANVTPGEGPIGLLPDGTTPIYHFQDDAVSGNITYQIGGPIQQTNMTPMNYIDNIDGPGPGGNAAFPFPGMGAYSKDLAFELYTQNNVPEPASLLLLATGSLALTLKRRVKQ